MYVVGTHYKYLIEGPLTEALFTLVLLSPDIPWIYPAFANSVDSDQLASEEAN